MGESFGSYEILRRIAVGGMAEVFLAKQRGIGGFERLVCVKRILPHLSTRQDFVTMFMDEARIAASVVHPNVAQIYDVGRIDDAYYIAMEYVRGEDLRHVYNQEVARGRAMPPEPAAQIAMGAASGLDHAHRQTALDGRPLDIVHRDVSPQNIVVTYDGHVKVVDFGVAKAAGKVAETNAGVLKGKYSYMSPEQAAGHRVDARTDVFALGVTLYEVTTGQRLFKRDNDIETLHAVIECEVRPPSEALPGYDPELEAVVVRALARDAGARFRSAAEMAQALERFLVRRGHPPSAARLGAYLCDLFAEKLGGDDPSGGGRDDPTTPAAHARPTPSRRRGGAPERTVFVGRRGEPGDDPAPPTRAEPPRAPARGRWDWPGSDPESETATRAPVPGSPDALAGRPRAPWVLLAAGRTPSPRAALLVAGISVLLVGGSGLGTALVRGDPGAGDAAARPGSERHDPLVAADPPTPAAVEPGTLAVVTDPPGAKVTLDGVPVAGRTPLRGLRVAGGEQHRLELRREGYEPRWEAPFVEPGARRVVEVVLTRERRVSVR